MLHCVLYSYSSKFIDACLLLSCEISHPSISRFMKCALYGKVTVQLICEKAKHRNYSCQESVIVVSLLEETRYTYAFPVSLGKHLFGR